MTFSSSTGELSPLRVDRCPQRRAVHRVPGELGAAEKACVALGLDADRVGGLARDIGGLGSTQESVVCEPGDALLDLGQRRRLLARRAASIRAVVSCGKGALEDGVRAGVIDPRAVTVRDHLAVAGGALGIRVGLKLEPEVPVGGCPEAPRRSAQDRIRALHVGAVDQVVGELDAGADSLDGRRREGIVDGNRQGLRRGLRTAARRGHGQGHGANANRHCRRAEREQPAGGDAAEILHPLKGYASSLRIF